MKNKKLIPIILISISIILFIVAIVLLLNTNYLGNSNKNANKQNSNNKVEEVESNKTETTTENNDTNKVENNTKPNPPSDSNKEEINSKNETTSTNQKEDNTNSGETIKYSEDDVISYFRLTEETVSSNQEDKSLREKIKTGFITIVDFIFYDKEVKGYTFDELTTSAKLKVIEIALSIDNKIDQYFPDYKDTIKDKYTDIKGKLAIKYLEFTQNLCESVSEDVCNQAKEDFNTMKESFDFTWELVKELAKTGSNKVKMFYESWKNSE